jgi:DNA-binding GntR family transcriptional regulator
VQRFVLAELDEQLAGGEPWLCARTLAERLEGVPPTTQACRSVRRALRRLAADGLVELDPRAVNHQDAAGRSSRSRRRVSVVARGAPARIDEVAERRARRAQARDLRRRVSEGAPRASSRDRSGVNPR